VFNCSISAIQGRVSVHVVAAEQGIVLPGLTLVCPDSHSCTLGGLGALAWGIGSTDAEHALVTGTLRVRKPRNMRVRFEGKLPAGTGAKDMMLNLISQYSAMGGNGYAVEFTGPCVLSLPVESRMTLCNMAVEFSAFTGLIAVDEKTIEYIQGRTYAPAGEQWELATENWKTLHSNPAATFDKELVIDGSCIQPTVTVGDESTACGCHKRGCSRPGQRARTGYKKVHVQGASVYGFIARNLHH